MQYSRQFKPQTDSLVFFGSTNNPLLTNFSVHSLCSVILNNDQIRYFKPNYITLGARTHFTLEALNSTHNLITIIVGELPCPDNCLAGQPFVDHQFEADHLKEIICNTMNIQFLVLHRCHISPSIDSFAIYGHSGTYPLRDIALGHKIYVAL